MKKLFILFLILFTFCGESSEITAVEDTTITTTSSTSTSTSSSSTSTTSSTSLTTKVPQPPGLVMEKCANELDPTKTKDGIMKYRLLILIQE